MDRKDHRPPGAPGPRRRQVVLHDRALAVIALIWLAMYGLAVAKW
ncbi:hypothetical protein [Streptomyces sp. NPDC005303]